MQILTCLGFWVCSFRLPADTRDFVFCFCWCPASKLFCKSTGPKYESRLRVKSKFSLKSMLTNWNNVPPRQQAWIYRKKDREGLLHHPPLSGSCLSSLLPPLLIISLFSNIILWSTSGSQVLLFLRIWKTVLR
jgi:hypothetical protein